MRPQADDGRKGKIYLTSPLILDIVKVVIRKFLFL